jgi:hypothetical protein
MRIYVDGTESAQGNGPAGDVSYRDGRPTGSSQDPFLVIGAAKQGVGLDTLAFSGWIDEFRISSRIRYTVPFDRPVAAFTADADTVLLFHFDDGQEGPCSTSVLDTSGRGTHGQCRFGGDNTPGPAYSTEVPFVPVPPRQRTWLLGNEGQPGPASPTSATPAPADPEAPIPPR